MIGKEELHRCLREHEAHSIKNQGVLAEKSRSTQSLSRVLPVSLPSLSETNAEHQGGRPEAAAPHLSGERWRSKLSRVSRAGTLVLLSLLWSGAAAGSDGRSLVEQVRAANDRFRDVAIAVSEGYAPIPCASGIDGGAMGIHYVKASLIGESVDIKAPQAIMYEPAADGRMQLIAVEYITTKGPALLGGQLFNFNGAPIRYGLGPFYELHVWAWKANPCGSFAYMNPAVSCEHAH